MSQPIISVENLGKRYRIHHEREESYSTLRDVIARKVKRLFNARSEIRNPQSSDEDFWALKGVSFEVQPGEVVGFIGRNGAGKSTLLKILSRITESTEGRVTLRGRVASLLEVGTGFHPELTGRENIFLNGAILGMTRAEIRKKFDEIVAFAEVEKFLDTPVKRYSSGMYVRLAFAVAAHLEPEILIIDEVLAVGDATFQKKCLGKMKTVGAAGRTVLFVSHNMSAITALCSRCVVLENGQLLADLPPSDAASLYLRETSASDCFNRPPQPNGKPTLISGRIVSAPDSPVLQITIKISTAEKRAVCLDMRLVDGLGTAVALGSLGTFSAEKMIALSQGVNSFEIAMPTNHLANGSYLISLDLTEPFAEYFDRADNCLSVDLARATPDSNTRILMQSWGFGSIQIPLSITDAQQN